MGGYLFDIMVHIHAYDSIPEKWQRQWKEATVGHESYLLTEIEDLPAGMIFS